MWYRPIRALLGDEISYKSFRAALSECLILIIAEQEKKKKANPDRQLQYVVVPPHTSQAGSSLVLRCLRTKNTAILRPPGAPLSCSTSALPYILIVSTYIFISVTSTFSTWREAVKMQKLRYFEVPSTV